MTNPLPYNYKDKASIIQYAKCLEETTLRIICNKEISEHSYKGKGNFGQLLEKFYFKYEPNSISDADFPEAGLELKSSPLKQLKNKTYQSKERLVLNIINYDNVVNQNFEGSDFWKKNTCLLLVFYLHDASLEVIDYIIKLVDQWNFPVTDLEIIKKDWEKIQRKIAAGKAHELSEGDTFYLGACTKGANAKTLRKQPNSPILAKQRAFSLKQGYVNHIIASIANDNKGDYGKLITDATVIKRKTLEEFVLAKFTSYYDLSDAQIISMLNVNLNRKAKNYYANITKAILGIELTKRIEEFEKADIVVKTVRLKPNNLPKEDLSFPYFKYKELATEEWDESMLKQSLEQKFLFIFFQESGNFIYLKEAKFWNMPYDHIESVKAVWQKTQQIVRDGEIVRAIKNGRRQTNFPNKRFNKISHVRPHAKNAMDSDLLPISDKVTGMNSYTKHCFWLNNTYIRDEIYLK